MTKSRPLAAPRRAAFNPGVYFARLPGLPKLDLRLEGVTTNRFTSPASGAYFFYYEAVYRNLYVNNGNLFGSWIGRAGERLPGMEHLSPRAQDQRASGLSQREDRATSTFPAATHSRLETSRRFLRPRPELELRGFFQYESWLEPVLAPTRQRDVTASVQFTWWPGLEAKRPYGWKPR